MIGRRVSPGASGPRPPTLYDRPQSLDGLAGIMDGEGR